MGPLLVAMVFYWATFGPWWFVGLLALVGMLTAIWAFAQEIHPRRAWFVAFSLACLYYLPMTWPFRDRWIFAALIYGLISAAYWLLPARWDRWRSAWLERAEEKEAGEKIR